jgi:hypothetical protein
VRLNRDAVEVEPLGEEILFRRINRGDLRLARDPRAIDLFEQVVAKDPAFAPAYAARASAYGWYLVLQVPSVGGLPVAMWQKPQERVHTSPRIMNVAVPAFQHSPMFGHFASSQIVCNA